MLCHPPRIHQSLFKIALTTHCRGGCPGGMLSLHVLNGMEPSALGVRSVCPHQEPIHSGPPKTFLCAASVLPLKRNTEKSHAFLKLSQF